jgi:hypothetical protein
MKITWTGLVAVLLFFSCKDKYPSTDEPDNIAIRKLMDSTHSASQRQDWPAVIQLIHPDVFQYISKKSFEQALQNTMSGDGFKTRIIAADIDSIYPSVLHKGNKYSLVRLTLSVELMLTGGSDSSKVRSRIPDDICDQLREGDEENFMDCRIVGNGVEYSMKDFSYAIYLARKKKWFVLSSDEDTDVIVNKIIPAEVRKTFGY